MTAPNVDMIAASLKSFSLRGGTVGGADGVGGDQSPLPHLGGASDESEGEVTVELNSEFALPSKWEQHLDLRTGDIFYIDWETGVRTNENPCTPAAVVALTYTSTYWYSDEDDQTSDAYSYVSHTAIGACYGDDDDDVGDEDEDEADDSDSADSSTISSASLAQTSTAEDAASGCSDGQVLVAAGCKSCFMYFMVPKSVRSCPKCGRLLLNLNHNGLM